MSIIKPLRKLNIDQLLFWVGILIYFIYVFSAIALDRMFFYDGANFYVGLISKDFSWPHWNDSERIRLFVDVFNQIYVSSALFLGITDLLILKKLFGFGLFFNQIIIYIWCINLSNRANNFSVLYIALLSYIVFVMPSEIFILNQAITTIALSWLLLHYVILRIHLNKIDKLIILISVFLLFRSHEGIVFIGPIISLACLVRLFILRIDSCKFIFILIFISGLLQSAYTIYWQNTHVTTQATDAFLVMMWTILSPNNLVDGNMRLSLLLILNVILSLIFIVINKMTPGRILFAKNILVIIASLVTTFAFYSALIPALDPKVINPIREFHSRTIIGFGSALMMFFCCILNCIYSDGKSIFNRILWTPLYIGVICASLWQLSNNFYWYKYLSFTKERIESSSGGLVPYPNINSYMPNKLHEFSLGWGWTTFGIAIQGKREVSNIFIPEGFPEWFVISKNPDIPIIIPFIKFDKGSLLDFSKLRSAI